MLDFEVILAYGIFKEVCVDLPEVGIVCLTSGLLCALCVSMISLYVS